MLPRIGFHGFQIHPNIIRQLFFLSFLIFLGFIIVSELYFMVGAFMGAVTLYVILMHPMKYLMIIGRWPSWLAAFFLMIVSLVIMVIPIAYMMKVAIEKLAPVLQDPTVVNRVFTQIHQFLMDNYSINVLNAENVEKISSQVLPVAQRTLGNTFSALGNVFLMYLVLYFMLVQSRQLEKWLRKNLPLKTLNVRKVIREIRNLVYSNALGIPIVALIQGAVATLGYWIFGVDEYILMGVLTAISSVIPIIGTLAVYLPLAIFQFVVGGTYEGLGVALWGFLIIGAVDNIARFLVQEKLANVHPLITLLGVIMGVNLFGFIGVIFGPLLLSVFFIMVRVYVDEFGRIDANKPDIIKNA